MTFAQSHCDRCKRLPVRRRASPVYAPFWNGFTPVPPPGRSQGWVTSAANAATNAEVKSMSRILRLQAKLDKKI